MSNVEFGYMEGEICNRNGCKGVIEDVIESCSCHLNPPCSKCVGDGCYCPDCGWEAFV